MVPLAIAAVDSFLLAVLVGLYFRTRRELEDLHILLQELNRLRREDLKERRR
jgi:hypothetical protein